MWVRFYGNGAVYIPKTHSFIHFVDGNYTTDKEDEIAVLNKQFQNDRLPIDASNIDSPIEEIESTETEQPKKRGRKPRKE